MRTRSSSKQTQNPSSNPHLDEQKDLVMSLVQEATELEDNSFFRSLYRDIASDSAIDGFLKKSRFYSLKQRCWKLPRCYSKLFDKNLYTPLHNIISSIVNGFWRDAAAQGLRHVVDTHETALRHIKSDPPSHVSRPSFVIKAEGPSFQCPCPSLGDSSSTLGFSSVAGCIETDFEGSQLPVPEQLARMAIYARQIFAHQPNRRFVRLLFLTGRQLRLFHFDRSGIQHTPELDIDQDPHTFVRLVLGISSPNETDLGLDTSIQWTIENGRKASGTLITSGVDDTEIVYPLVGTEPFFSRLEICGRGTTCWKVLDASSGEELLVKDSWRPDDKTSEHVNLEKALGIPGVVQMVSCEPNRSETKHLRCFFAQVPPSFQNRVQIRVVMKYYGEPINKFNSAKQLLFCLRDSIEAHRSLLKKEVLHRDVSLQNILNGKPGADPGSRAILSDLDMAIQYTVDDVVSTDWRIGNCLYQSSMVLSSREMSRPLAHDHLDDLESFLYVLAYIIHIYDSQGIFCSIPRKIELWSEHGNDHDILASLKQSFLVTKTIPLEISSRWPNACLEVFHRFREFIRSFVYQKISLIDNQPADGEDILRTLRLCADDHYDYILRLFDEGIVALEKDEAENLPPTQRNSLKRPSNDYPDSQPVAKRRTLPHVLSNPRSPWSYTRENPRST